MKSLLPIHLSIFNMKSMFTLVLPTHVGYGLRDSTVALGMNNKTTFFEAVTSGLDGSTNSYDRTFGYDTKRIIMGSTLYRILFLNIKSINYS